MRHQPNISPRVRRARIADLVRQEGEVKVDVLVKMFGASHETIRRDLSALADTGDVLKFHGGAKIPRRVEEGPFQERMTLNEPAKREIAAKTARLLRPGDTVFIDTGSTTLMCAQEFAQIDRLTVITNSALNAASVYKEGRVTKTYLVGGAFDGDNKETYGGMAIEQLSSFVGDHAVIGAAALNAKGGIMNANANEADVARAMMGRVDNVIIVADSGKFDQQATFSVCGFDKVNVLVSEAPPQGALADALAVAEVRVI